MRSWGCKVRLDWREVVDINHGVVIVNRIYGDQREGLDGDFNTKTLRFPIFLRETFSPQEHEAHKIHELFP